MKIQLKTWP